MMLVDMVEVKANQVDLPVSFSVNVVVGEEDIMNQSTTKRSGNQSKLALNLNSKGQTTRMSQSSIL